jgi:fumarate reductase iron-sulfur subunit
MSAERMNVRVFRFDPLGDKEPYYRTYEVPFEEGMSAMNALDYIYQNLDSTLAYYDHAGCSLGICGRCTGKINGKAGLFCQTLIKGDTTLEPLSESRVLKDLVLEKREGAQVGTSDSAEGAGAAAHDIGRVPILLRREIEALIAAPLIKAFIEEFGRERTLAIARRVIASLAHESGKLLAVVAGGNTMENLKKAMPLFSQGGALELEMLETTQAQAAFNVTRCRYAEMYKEHGLEEFGYLLSCGRDFALIQGFNPKIRLTRTQTIMEGAEYCDFRFSFEGE